MSMSGDGGGAMGGAGAVEACAAGQWSAAIKILSTQLEDCQLPLLQPSLLCNRALCYSKLDLNKHALKDANRAIALDPNFITAYLRKGSALWALGKTDDAAAALGEGYRRAVATGADMELTLRLHSLHLNPTLLAPQAGAAAAPVATGSAARSAVSMAQAAAAAAAASDTRPGDGRLPAEEGAAAAGAGKAGGSGDSRNGSAGAGGSVNGAVNGVGSSATTKNEQMKKTVGIATKNGASTGPAATATSLSSSSSSHSSSPSLLAAAMSGPGSQAASANVSGGRQTFHADLLLSMGIAQVNAGQFDDGIKIFDRILATDPKAVGALIGRGTALALQRKLEAAIADFSKAIAINPKAAEAWKRRAQARAATGMLKEVVEDFTQALHLDPSFGKDVLLERGTVYVKLRDYKAALRDLQMLVAMEPTNKLAHNFMGLALTGSGECVEGIRAYKKALQLDPAWAEAWTNMGQTHKELGDAVKAAECFQKAIDLDKSKSTGYRLWALLKYGCGDHRGSEHTAAQGLALDPQNIELRYIHASAQHAIGDYANAVREYDDTLGLEGSAEEQVLQFLAFYQREIALYTASKLNEPFANFRLDADLQPFFKEAWCKKIPPTLLFPGYKQQPLLPLGTGLGGGGHGRRKREGGGAQPAARQRLLDAADRIGRRTQYSCPGFLPNQRQHRMAGLAVVEIMQCVIAFWHQSSRDSSSSSISSSGRESSGSSPRDSTGSTSSSIGSGNGGGSSSSGGSPGSRSDSPSGGCSAGKSPGRRKPKSGGGGGGGGGQSGEASDNLQEDSGVVANGEGSLSQPSTVPEAAATHPSVYASEAAAELTATRGAGIDGSSSSSSGRSSSAGGGKGMSGADVEQAVQRRATPAASALPSAPPSPAPGQIRGWRDVFSIAVRWRQLSEPCDPVAWVDMLTKEEFAQGFGSHTPMLLGQTRVVRYYANFQRAFRIMKQQILQTGGAFNANNQHISLNDLDLRRQISAAKEPRELHELVGEDFWVVTPCYSMAEPGKVLDGTRLTLVKSPTGYDFAIRTPGTPSRWADYDLEMESAWQELCEAVRAQDDAAVAAAAADQQSKEQREQQQQQQQQERIRMAVLRMGFYWYNFMPLARGTAMVGYVTMLGLLLGANMEVTAGIPRGMQVDWEAILCPRYESFASTVSAWIFSGVRSDSPFRAVAKVWEALPTINSVVSALSTYGDNK